MRTPLPTETCGGNYFPFAGQSVEGNLESISKFTGSDEDFNIAFALFDLFSGVSPALTVWLRTRI